MLEKFMGKVHIFIIAYALYTAWQSWTDVNLKLEESNSEFESLNIRVRKLKKEKRKIAKFLKDIEKAKKKMLLVEEEVKIIQKKLPAKIDDTENLGMIKKIALGLNIKNIFLAPGKEDNRGFYFAKKYDLTATGTYLQFLLLCEKLSTSERLYNVVDIELMKSKVNRRGRFQLVNGKFSIESFRYNLNFDKDKKNEIMKGKI